MLPIFVTNFKRGDAGGVEVMIEERKLFDELMEAVLGEFVIHAATGI